MKNNFRDAYHISECNTPKIAPTSSALGYFAVRSGFCTPRIVKRSARAHRWKRLGFESGIPRYARRSRGIRTLFLAQVHPWPNGWEMLVFWLTALIIFWCVHVLIDRPAPIFQPVSYRDRHRSGRCCAGDRDVFAPLLFRHPSLTMISRGWFYGEMYGNNLGSVKRSAVPCGPKRETRKNSQNFTQNYAAYNNSKLGNA